MIAASLLVPFDCVPVPVSATGERQKSGANGLVQSFVPSDAFRDFFMTAFARWLQLNFQRPEHVAAVFGVRHQTALNWWNGRNCASGDTIGVVFLTFPSAVEWFLAEWRLQE